MKFNFDKEMKKEKMKLFKNGNKQEKIKITKDLKNVLVGAAAILVGVKGLEVLNN